MVEKKKYNNRKMRKNITNEDLHLCAYAADKIKSIGFRIQYTSSCSEACYYDHPSYDGMIRIAAHRYGRTASKKDSFSHMKPVISCITFGNVILDIPTESVEL